MKYVMSSRQTPVKSSMGFISLASPTKPAINIKIPQVTPPAFTWEQGQAGGGKRVSQIRTPRDPLGQTLSNKVRNEILK